jgi:hypothetical protein
MEESNLDAEEDKEAQEMIKSSKFLSEIYGNKIKQNITWYFEQPVVMKAKAFGIIEQPPKDYIHQGGDASMNYDYGDEYGDEYGMPMYGGFNPKPPGKLPK